MSPRSVDHRLCELRWLLSYAVEQEFIESASKVKMTASRGLMPCGFSFEKVCSVLPYMPEAPIPHRAMLLFALNSGLTWRVSATGYYRPTFNGLMTQADVTIQ